MAYPLESRLGQGVGLVLAGGFVLAAVSGAALAAASLAGASAEPVADNSQPLSPRPPANVPQPQQQTGQPPAAAPAGQAAMTPPALSPSCEAPAADIAANAPLPHVTRVLAEHKPVQILAIGSAASASLGMDSGVQSYPVRLEGMLKDALKGVDVDIINRGTGGEVAQTSADRIRTEVAMVKPDLVLWQLGTNDALARVDPDEFTDIVASTIDWLRDNDIDVVLVGLQYTTRFAKDESYYAIRKALEKIAKNKNILYVKRYDAMRFIAQTRAKVHLMASDNYHLSELGTQCQAEHVARAMIANLFVRRFRPGVTGSTTPGPIPTR